MTDKLLVLTTTGSEEEAHNIANALVERRLAACVNIIPRIHSVYRWEGKVEQADEWLLVVKTDRPHQEQVYTAIRELHSYSLPEFIAIAVEAGSKEYLDWMEEAIG
jgi:periplasmic divalent cation tolerance protein